MVLASWAPSSKGCLAAIWAALWMAIALAGCGGGGGASIPPFDLAFSIAVADLNNDGSLDLAVAAAHVAGAPPHPGFCSVILQQPSAPGTFAGPTHFAAGSDSISIAAADLNADGKQDLVIGNNTSANISILIQDPGNPGEFLPAVNLITGAHPSGPAGIAIGDLNGDGLPDIAVAGANDRLSIFFQDPSGPPGSFLPQSSLALGQFSEAVALGDINGDGKLDIVAATSSDTAPGRISVLLQDPINPGTFLPATNFGAGAQPSSVKIADLNDDGLPDLAVANYGPPSDTTKASVSVLLQDPANEGSFLPATNYRTGVASTDVAIGDLNGDGKPDLAVANDGSLSIPGSVSVLLQDPATPGAFLPRVNYAGVMPFSVAIGDLNGDGLPDIAVADGENATIMFQKPGAPGSFFSAAKVGL